MSSGSTTVASAANSSSYAGPVTRGGAVPAKRKATTQPRSKGTANRLQVVPDASTHPGNSPEIPPLPGSKTLLQETRDWWKAFWSEPQAQAVTGAQRVVLLRWVRAYDQWARTLRVVEKTPLVTGSMGQPVANPLISWVTSREAEMAKCERQLGIGLKNLADLGISTGQAKLTAAELNRMTREDPPGDHDHDDEIDAVEAEVIDGFLEA